MAIASPGGAWSYEYNALRQRTAVIFNGVRTDYLLDPSGMGDIVAEYQAGDLVAHFVYGAGLEASVSASGELPLFYAFDGAGNASALVSPAGDVVDSYSYLPFGEKMSSAGSTANPFTFGARAGVMDGGEGLYFMRNRSYNPAVGHFTQPDPAGSREA